MSDFAVAAYSSRWLSGHGAEQRPPVVDDGDPRLVRRVALDDASGQRAQQTGLARLAVAENEQVRVRVDVEVERRELGLVDAEQQQARRTGGLRQLVVLDQVRQHPDRAGRRAGPGVADRLGERLRAVGEVERGRRAVDARQPAEEVELRLRDAAARRRRPGR